MHIQLLWFQEIWLPFKDLQMLWKTTLWNCSYQRDWWSSLPRQCPIQVLHWASEEGSTRQYQTLFRFVFNLPIYSFIDKQTIILVYTHQAWVYLHSINLCVPHQFLADPLGCVWGGGGGGWGVTPLPPPPPPLYNASLSVFCLFASCMVYHPFTGNLTIFMSFSYDSLEIHFFICIALSQYFVSLLFNLFWFSGWRATIRL